jgi:hypothetical protein
MSKQSDHTVIVKPEKKSMDEGKKRVDAGILTAVIQDEQLKELRTIRKHMQMQISKGQTKPMNLYIVGGAGFIHLDFLKTEFTNIPMAHMTNPNWTQVNLPQSLLFDLNLINNGPGRVAFATNVETNSTQCDTPLPAGRSINLKNIYPTIRSLNIIAPDGDASVTLIGVV